MTRRPRDPRHHACVDRQAYHTTSALLVGWGVAGLLDWLAGPWWVAGLVLLALVLLIPVLELAWDAEERRRAKLTPEDKAAGRW